MQYIKKILDVIIGYSGSTEDPTKMSLRFSSLIVGVISKLAAVAAIAGYVLPYTDAQVQFTVASLSLVIASGAWVFGLVRVIWNSIFFK